MLQKNLTEEHGVIGVFRDVDDNIHTVGVVVDDPVVDTGIFKSRLYDVRTLDEFSAIIRNIDSTNGLTYTIGTATKTFDIVSELVDADFTNDGSHTAVALAAGAIGATFVLDRSANPSVLAVRLEAIETIATNASLLAADIRGSKK